jgi:flagellar biosynthesis chaperone FliJ
LERAVLHLREQTHGVDHARGTLTEARRSVEALERLERRQRAEHRRALLAEEERDLADVTEMRSARRIFGEHRTGQAR